MQLGDGRVVPTFLAQCLRGEDLPVFGNGHQSRSFCYVDDLIEGAREYFRQTGRKITFEYCLLGGLNSRREHAVELADRLRALNCYVNLIPWNPVDEIDLKAPTEVEVEVFAKLLRSAGAEVAIRRQRGADIDAACGQLKLKEETLPILQA